MFTKFYVPAAGLVVVDPANIQPLPADGKQVKGNQTYWTRRESDGAVSERQPPSKPAKAK